MKEFWIALAQNYHEHGRHELLWRQNKFLNPYAIAVSEIMLQQTQVSRVVGYFEKWMQQFPDVYSLAEASNSDVLRAWQGLGYNSRGLRLKKLAEVIVRDYGGVFPRDSRSLEALPGIGPYTAGAIRAFVWNEPDVCIETNIRRVMIHHFFADTEGVRDTEIVHCLARIMETPSESNLPLSIFEGKRFEARKFYWALMDYGATLPKILKHNPNTQSKHYTKQSRFEGSVRQVRSGIVKLLLEHHQICVVDIAGMLGLSRGDDERISTAIKGLKRDGLITMENRKLFLKN